MEDKRIEKDSVIAREQMVLEVYNRKTWLGKIITLNGQITNRLEH